MMDGNTELREIIALAQSETNQCRVRRAAVATVHAAKAVVREELLQLVDPRDFVLDEGFALENLPRGLSIPYAFDLSRQELLCTMHLQPGPVLDEPFLYAAQRYHARVVARVPWASLDGVFGPVDRTTSPVLIFSIARAGSTLLNALLSCGSPRVIFEPDTVTQLGMKRARFQALGRDLHDRLVWHSISAFLRPDNSEPLTPMAIKLRSQANDAVSDIMQMFPKAKFVFMLRERRAWARSNYRAFREPAVEVVERLVGGISALKKITDAPVDHLVLRYDQLIAAPKEAVARLLNLSLPLAPDMGARIEAVMAADSQANSPLSRDRTSQAAPGEDVWLEDFDAIWTRRRPKAVLDMLKLDEELCY